MDRFEREGGFALSEFKADTDDTGALTGQFEAIVSVFGNVDLGNDRVMPGAFAKSLERWRKSGDPIPVIWNHMWDLPEAHIGAVDPNDAEETDGGLKVKGNVDLDQPFAAQVFRLLSKRRVKEFSFGYNVRDAKRNSDGVKELIELDIIEVGPTLKGMNPATELLAVKALAQAEDAVDALAADQTAVVDTLALDAEIATKAGARLSKSSRSTIEQAVGLLSELLAADQTGDAEQESKAMPPNSDTAQIKAIDPDEEIRTLINLLKET